MINDPNYNLPKDAFIRLFDNPIPAGDPARSEAPEWAQELDEVVVWAHMGDNGQVSVKVNGEDIGGGGGELQTATLTIDGPLPNVPVVIDDPALAPYPVILNVVTDIGDIIEVPVPTLLSLYMGQSLVSIDGSYEEPTPGVIIITGDCSISIDDNGGGA